LEFRKGVTADYPSLFSTGNGRNDFDGWKDFNERWGWYGSLMILSGNDITKQPQILKMNFRECLAFLDYTKDYERILRLSQKTK
jgi:hypothetical protein